MRRFVIALVVVAVLAVGAILGWRKITDQVKLALPDQCTATVGNLSATLDPEQAQNAALITAIAVRRGLPAHAATIALATAMQESKLFNLTSGDRDSLGLFQQRPSQGWGTRKQIMDPVFATNSFYDALLKLPDFRTAPVTEAAQRVQRCAYPGAYAKHEDAARALASALTGESDHAFTCRLSDPGTGTPTTVRDEIAGVFGSLVGTPVITGARVTTPVANATIGWSAAQYLVGQASRLGIHRVEYDGYAWTGGLASSNGWVPHPAASPGFIGVTVNVSGTSSSH